MLLHNLPRSFKTSLMASFILTVLFSFMLPVYALENDFQQTLHIVSDSATHNYKQGLTIYLGNVKVDQGTSHITADKLITKKNNNGQIEEAIAYGLKTVAHYWTILKPNDPTMHARAKVIKFYPITSNVTLEREVSVIQGDNSFRGEIVLYNNSEQTITVPPSKNGRAVIVYTPEKK